MKSLWGGVEGRDLLSGRCTYGVAQPFPPHTEEPHAHRRPRFSILTNLTSRLALSESIAMGH